MQSSKEGEMTNSQIDGKQDMLSEDQMIELETIYEGIIDNKEALESYNTRIVELLS